MPTKIKLKERTVKAVHFIQEYFDLERDLDDFDKIHESISKDIVFKGTNLWILIFAIIVASVGLNMNSTAVIIGAMLISPLMGPINGMGYSIATYNFDLFRKSIKNFSFAVLASIVASTTYFALSPISTAYSELLARTSPTIYDVLIALFGGAAGIVAITSKQKGNVIPGVAIATALMPPLCTAGYGLATGKLDFFFGAFYLFTINTVFIALASLIVSQVLKFPIRTIVEPAQRVKVNRWIWTVILIVFLPSIYFGYQLVQEEKFTENAKKFISNVSIFEGNYLLNSEINTSEKHIHLIYGGMNLDSLQKKRIKSKIYDFGLKETSIEISQGLSFENDADDKYVEILKLRNELERLQQKVKYRDKAIDSIKNIGKFGEVLLAELQPLFPSVRECIYAETFVHNDTIGEPVPASVIYFSLNKKMESKELEKKLENWLKRRLKTEAVILRLHYWDEKN